MKQGATDGSDTAAPLPIPFSEFVALGAMLMALTALSIDIMLPALPQIAAEYRIASDNDRQLVVFGYLIGSGPGQILFLGQRGDALPRVDVTVNHIPRLRWCRYNLRGRRGAVKPRRRAAAYARISTARSATLVPVAPVMTSAPPASSAGVESLRASACAGSIPPAQIAAMVPGPTSIGKVIG